MKPIFLILFVILSFSLYGQDDIISKKEQRKLAKEQKQSEQGFLREGRISDIKDILEKQQFVLEADYIDDGRGNRIPVSSTLNFIVVDSLSGVLQIGSPSGFGWNGVGGVTVEGNITRYELSIINGKRRTSYALEIVIMSTVGIYDVHFNISETGIADASVRSTTKGQLRYSGEIVPIKHSRVYKGLSSY